MSGTGSKNIIVHEAFVPQHRVLRFADTRSGRTPGARHHKNPLYRLPLLVLGATMLASTAVGAAKAALESYLAMTTGRTTRGALAGGGLAIADRIRCRRNQAYTTKLALEAMEALNASTGGYGLMLSNPVQRAWRDVNAVARHVSLNWDAVGAMYGQHAFGLEPRGQY